MILSKHVDRHGTVDDGGGGFEGLVLRRRESPSTRGRGRGVRKTSRSGEGPRLDTEEREKDRAGGGIRRTTG